jgi:hypothetical protein
LKFKNKNMDKNSVRNKVLKKKLDDLINGAFDIKEIINAFDKEDGNENQENLIMDDVGIYMGHPIPIIIPIVRKKLHREISINFSEAIGVNDYVRYNSYAFNLIPSIITEGNPFTLVTKVEGDLITHQGLTHKSLLEKGWKGNLINRRRVTHKFLLEKGWKFDLEEGEIFITFKKNN